MGLFYHLTVCESAGVKERHADLRLPRHWNFLLSMEYLGQQCPTKYCTLDGSLASWGVCNALGPLALTPNALCLQTADSTSACITGKSWWKSWPRPAPKAVGSPTGTPMMPVTWTKSSSPTQRTMVRGKTSRNCWVTWKGVWSSGWPLMGSMPKDCARAGSTGTGPWHCAVTGPTNWREIRPASCLTHSSSYQVMRLTIG